MLLAIAKEVPDCTESLHLQSVLLASKGLTLHGELEVRKAALLECEALGHHAALLEMVHFKGAYACGANLLLEEGFQRDCCN